MNTIAKLVAATLLGAASVAGAQVNIPNPAAPGGSPESAVRLQVTSDLMLDRYIKRWLHQHYPGWSADPHEFMELGTERYAVVYITAPNETGRREYFRVARSALGDDENDFPPAL